MKTRIVAICYLLSAIFELAFAQGTAFSYQGRLNNGGTPTSGTYNFTFTLFNVSSAGSAVAGPVTTNSVIVSNGLFIVTMDFGSGVWNGQTNWLEVGVETNGAASFTTMAPRQQITPVPYAIFAETASNLSGQIGNGQLADSSVTVTAGTALNGGGTVALGGSITLNNAGVTSLTGGGGVTVSAPNGSVTLGSNATSADTGGAIVQRDASGSFSAGSLTLAGTLNLPPTTPSSGFIELGGVPVLHAFGPGNFFTGPGAGNFGMTGTQNTAEGFGALQNNSGGSANTADGYLSLASNTGGRTGNGTEGSYNTATGADALSANTLGSYNTADGFDALLQNTQGSDNTAVGEGALFANTVGFYNTAVGENALFSNSGSFNTAVGCDALGNNTTGNFNVADGYFALLDNNDGIEDTAVGYQALFNNTNGSADTAIGDGALYNNFSGVGNTACGENALYYNSTGGYNIGLGLGAGSQITTGSNNIEIYDLGQFTDNNTIRIGSQGVQSNTFVAGIYGATAASGVPVYVNSSGQLGTLTSSARFKEDIKSMEDASDVLLSLRPVTFRYKPGIDPKGIPQFGLVAEEVDKVDPDLVARDDTGQPYTVRYEAVNTMLLNEFLKQHQTVEEQGAEIQQLQKSVDELKALVLSKAKVVQNNSK